MCGLAVNILSPMIKFNREFSKNCYVKVKADKIALRIDLAKMVFVSHYMPSHDLHGSCFLCFGSLVPLRFH